MRLVADGPEPPDVVGVCNEKLSPDPLKAHSVQQNFE